MPLDIDFVSNFLGSDHNYVVWSDIFICPTCGEELVFWDVAIGDKKEVKNPFYCTKCGSELKKSSCKRAQEPVLDATSGEIMTQAKQIPTMINYVYRGKNLRKEPTMRILRFY